jgi:hypothetical protein
MARLEELQKQYVGETKPDIPKLLGILLHQIRQSAKQKMQFFKHHKSPSKLFLQFFIRIRVGRLQEDFQTTVQPQINKLSKVNLLQINKLSKVNLLQINKQSTNYPR